MRGVRFPPCRSRRGVSRVVVAAALVSLALVTAGGAGVPLLPAEIPAAERARLVPIADQADVATQVEAAPFVARPEIFEYLLDHPDFASHLVRALRLARYKVVRTAQGLFLDDGWGVTGHFWVVYAADGTRVVHARGQYNHVLLPTISGDAVTVIAYDATPAADGRSVFHTRFTGFVKLDSRFVARMMKLASAVAQRKADREARKIMEVFAEVSRAVDTDPAGVLAKVRERPDVPRRELAEFEQLVSAR
jgi:hypothetical protein